MRIVALAVISISCLAQTPRLTRPEDLLAVKNVAALALSPDGQNIAFVEREASLKDDKYKNSLWLMPAHESASPRKILDDCDSPQWSSDSKQLACLAPRGGRPQIVIVNAATLATELESSAPDGVVSFQWAPGGRQIAFLSRQAGAPPSSTNSERGVVIDKRTAVVYTFLANDLFIDLTRPTHLDLLNLGAKTVEHLITSFDVEAVSWSPDGKTLAVTGKERPELGYPESVYLYSLDTKKATCILQGVEQNHFPTQQYSRPTWSPDGSELAAVSTSSEDRWANTGKVGIYSLQTGKFRLITDEDHLQLYQARFFWRDHSAITFENTVRASTQLFRLALDGAVTALTKFDGENSLFSLSANGLQAAFVHQSFQHPPEIYTASVPFADLKKLSALNVSSDHTSLPPAERIQWNGAGGVSVEGWLIKPPNYDAARRYPLLVMVHGGPGAAITDSFEPYSMNGTWVWPYPFRIFVERGYLVFIPNYRGTSSYGKQFAMFRDMAGEPADDIVSGVEYLIQRGVADPSLVGILGQSHGAWLGPVVLTRHKEMFKAASFAEGALNSITQYGLMPGWLNLYTHEFYNPGNPYDNLQHLIDISPIFDMKGLLAPTLLEFGQRSLAVLGLETVTAMWRQGVPHEMVVYPKEGHNLMSPVNLLESIHRNLDWFDYWMLGKKNPDPQDKEEYARWEAMTKEMQAMRSNNASEPANRARH